MENKIVILMSCISKLESEGVFKSHFHPYYQLNHILKGNFTYTVNEQTFQAKPGDTILIPSNSIHSLMSNSKSNAYYYEVKFSTYSKKDKELCDDISVNMPQDHFTGELLAAIIKENENLTKPSLEVMVNYLYSILYNLSAEARRQKNVPSKYIEVSSYSEPTRQTILFLEDNYSRKLSLQDIVAHTNIKKSHLCRIFKEETSLTIFECLMIIRVRKAIELLTFTSMSLAQISRETSFANLTHFSRVFTKHVMIPPGQYRKHLHHQGQYMTDAEHSQEMQLPVVRVPLSGEKIDITSLTSFAIGQ